MFPAVSARIFPKKMPKIVRGIVSILLLTGLAVGVLSYRLIVDGKRFLEEAEQADRGEVSWRKVVSLYEDAAKTYFPGNPYPERALWRLSLMAKSAHMRGEQGRRRYIWEVVRRSAVSQRHVFQPFSSYVKQATMELAAIDERLASTSTRALKSAPKSASKTAAPPSIVSGKTSPGAGAALDAENGQLVTDDGLEDPGIFATILLFLGLMVWIVAASACIFASGKKAVMYFGVSLLGLFLWIGAAWMA